MFFLTFWCCDFWHYHRLRLRVSVIVCKKQRGKFSVWELKSHNNISSYLISALKTSENGLSNFQKATDKANKAPNPKIHDHWVRGFHWNFEKFWLIIHTSFPKIIGWNCCSNITPRSMITPSSDSKYA